MRRWERELSSQNGQGLGVEWGTAGAAAWLSLDSSMLRARGGVRATAAAHAWCIPASTWLGLELGLGLGLG